MKPVSDTPESKAASHNMGSVRNPHYVVDLEVAESLERQRNEAVTQAEIYRLRLRGMRHEKDNGYIGAVFGEFDPMVLLAENRELKRKLTEARQALDSVNKQHVEAVAQFKLELERSEAQRAVIAGERDALLETIKDCEATFRAIDAKVAADHLERVLEQYANPTPANATGTDDSSCDDCGMEGKP